jgi:hypothetical protein
MCGACFGADEGYSCADDSHDHHHNGIEGAWSYQLQTTLEFNKALKRLGVYQTGADAYVFSGANKWVSVTEKYCLSPVNPRQGR